MTDPFLVRQRKKEEEREHRWDMKREQENIEIRVNMVREQMEI